MFTENITNTLWHLFLVDPNVFSESLILGMQEV